MEITAVDSTASANTKSAEVGHKNSHRSATLVCEEEGWGTPLSEGHPDSQADLLSGKYEDDGWDDQRRAVCEARLSACGPELPAHSRARHATKFGRYWDAFYRSNKTNFFKDRHYLEDEFSVLRE